MPPSSNLSSLLLMSGANATDELAKVKAGWAAADEFPMEILLFFGAGLAAIIVLGLVVKLLQRSKHRQAFGAWVTITAPKLVSSILNRAVARQADINMEIYNQEHTGSYRARLVRLREGRLLEAEMIENPQYGLNFKSQPVQVHLNFRPGINEPMEHYQFTSQTLDISYPIEKSWRAARLALAWPPTLISAQRRNYLRLEPVGKHAMTCSCHYEPYEQFKGQTDLELISEAKVLDISLGGIQLHFDKVLRLNEGRKFIGVIDLPQADLGLELKETKLFILMRMLSLDLIGPNLANLEDDDAQPSTGGNTVVRFNFLGRYQFCKESGLWLYKAFSLEKFQDLAYWMQACQRFQIQKDLGLSPPSHPDRVNRYPSIPPDRPTPKED